MRSGRALTEDLGKNLDRAQALLMAGAKDAHQDGLGLGPRVGPVARTGLAVHDRRSNRLLGWPVGRLDVVALEEKEQRVLVAPKMGGKATVLGIGDPPREQALHADLQPPTGDSGPVYADLTRIPSVAYPQG